MEWRSFHPPHSRMNGLAFSFVKFSFNRLIYAAINTRMVYINKLRPIPSDVSEYGKPVWLLMIGCRPLPSGHINWCNESNPPEDVSERKTSTQLIEEISLVSTEWPTIFHRISFVVRCPDNRRYIFSSNLADIIAKIPTEKIVAGELYFMINGHL